MDREQAITEGRRLLEQERARAQHMTNDELKQCITGGVRLVRDTLLRMAAAIGELDARGVRVRGDRYLFTWLRKVAAGRLLIDVVVRFASSRPVMEEAQ